MDPSTIFKGVFLPLLIFYLYLISYFFAKYPLTSIYVASRPYCGVFTFSFEVLCEYDILVQESDTIGWYSHREDQKWVDISSQHPLHGEIERMLPTAFPVKLAPFFYLNQSFNSESEASSISLCDSQETFSYVFPYFVEEMKLGGLECKSVSSGSISITRSDDHIYVYIDDGENIDVNGEPNVTTTCFRPVPTLCINSDEEAFRLRPSKLFRPKFYSKVEEDLNNSKGAKDVSVVSIDGLVRELLRNSKVIEKQLKNVLEVELKNITGFLARLSAVYVGSGFIQNIQCDLNGEDWVYDGHQYHDPDGDTKMQERPFDSSDSTFTGEFHRESRQDTETGDEKVTVERSFCDSIDSTRMCDPDAINRWLQSDETVPKSFFDIRNPDFVDVFFHLWNEDRIDIIDDSKKAIQKERDSANSDRSIGEFKLMLNEKLKEDYPDFWRCVEYICSSKNLVAKREETINFMAEQIFSLGDKELNITQSVLGFDFKFQGLRERGLKILNVNRTTSHPSTVRKSVIEGQKQALIEEYRMMANYTVSPFYKSEDNFHSKILKVVRLLKKEGVILNDESSSDDEDDEDYVPPSGEEESEFELGVSSEEEEPDMAMDTTSDEGGDEEGVDEFVTSSRKRSDEVMSSMHRGVIFSKEKFSFKNYSSSSDDICPSTFHSKFSDEYGKLWERTNEIFDDKSLWLDKKEISKEQRLHENKLFSPKIGTAKAINSKANDHGSLLKEYYEFYKKFSWVDPVSLPIVCLDTSFDFGEGKCAGQCKYFLGLFENAIQSDDWSDFSFTQDEIDSFDVLDISEFRDFYVKIAIRWDEMHTEQAPLTAMIYHPATRPIYNLIHFILFGKFLPESGDRAEFRINRKRKIVRIAHELFKENRNALLEGVWHDLQTLTIGGVEYDPSLEVDVKVFILGEASEFFLNFKKFFQRCTGEKRRIFKVLTSYFLFRLNASQYLKYVMFDLNQDIAMLTKRPDLAALKSDGEPSIAEVILEFFHSLGETAMEKLLSSGDFDKVLEVLVNIPNQFEAMEYENLLLGVKVQKNLYREEFEMSKFSKKKSKRILKHIKREFKLSQKNQLRAHKATLKRDFAGPDKTCGMAYLLSEVEKKKKNKHSSLSLRVPIKQKNGNFKYEGWNACVLPLVAQKYLLDPKNQKHLVNDFCSMKKKTKSFKNLECAIKEFQGIADKVKKEVDDLNIIEEVKKSKKSIFLGKKRLRKKTGDRNSPKCVQVFLTELMSYLRVQNVKFVKEVREAIAFLVNKEQKKHFPQQMILYFDEKKVKNFGKNHSVAINEKKLEKLFKSTDFIQKQDLEFVEDCRDDTRTTIYKKKKTNEGKEKWIKYLEKICHDNSLYVQSVIDEN